MTTMTETNVAELFSIPGSDLRILNQLKDGRREITAPIVRRRGDDLLYIDEGLFITRQTGTLMTMEARHGYQTPANKGKGIMQVIKNARALGFINLPGRRRSDGTYGPWGQGMVVAAQLEDANKLVIDGSVVRIYQSRAQGAPLLNTVSGVFAIELAAWLQLQRDFGNMPVQLPIDTSLDPIDAAIWEESAKHVIANGPVPIEVTFDNGDVLKTFALPRGTQRQAAIDATQQANAQALANDPLNHISGATRILAQPQPQVQVSNFSRQAPSAFTRFRAGR